MAAPAPALPAPIEGFLAGRTTPQAFRELLHDTGISTVDEIANMADTVDALRENVYAMLNIPGINPTGHLRPAGDATPQERQEALATMTRIRGLWEAARSFSGTVDLHELENSADVPISVPMFEHLAAAFYGTDTERGYDFHFSTSERGHDRLVGLLRKHAANGFLRTIELSKVYAQNETPKLIVIMSD